MPKNQLDKMYRDAFHQSSFGLLILNKDWRCIDANQAAAQLLGITRQRMIGHKMLRRLAPSRKNNPNPLFREIGSEYELHFSQPNGEITQIAVRTRAYFHGDCHLFVLQNITQQKEAEDVLRKQAQRLDFADDTIMIRDLNDIITYWNQGAERFYGWSKMEALGKYVHTFLKTEFPEPIKDALRKCIQQGNWEGVLKHRKRDGTSVTVASRWTLERDDKGRPTGFLEINNDITEREEAKEQLQVAYRELERKVLERTSELSAANARLKALSAKLMSAHEEERERISRDLHDDLGQILTSMLVNLQRARQMKDAGKVKALLDTVLSAHHEARIRLRAMSSRLRPRVLDEVGLKEALHTHITEFETDTGVKTRFTFAAQNADFQSDVSTSIYRILQEALTNVSSHARASRVSVNVSVKKGHALLRIRDNGIGFDLNAIRLDRTLGLSGMRERAELLGGRFLLRSGPGKGTELSASFPLARGVRR